MQSTTVTRTVIGHDAALALTTHLASRERWLTFQPLGDDTFKISVKPEDQALLENCGVDHKAYMLVQEGGTSKELYVHAHESHEDALEDRYNCTTKGSYRTSGIVNVPAVLNALGDIFYSTVDAIIDASTDLAHAVNSDANSDDDADE